MIILLIIWSYYIFSDVPLMGISASFESFRSVETSILFLSYVLGLGISTLIGEGILKIFPPIRITPIERI